MNKERTEELIKHIKDTFEQKLSKELNLLRVSGPLILNNKTGLNDDLGDDRSPVEFWSKQSQSHIQIVQSLAKWKRVRLSEFTDYANYKGLYVDMNAIRMNEWVDFLHSYYVDQWDWEMIIKPEERNIEFLKKIVRKINKVICDIWVKDYDVYFITAQELLDKYPQYQWEPKQREYEITKEHKCVFIIGIGEDLSNGMPHDNRASDYDDWSLNGDLIYWSDALQMPIEISSMGIRVNKESLAYQLNVKNENDKLELPYHKMVMNDSLPLTIGGGIGQSRLCMLMLNKRHIGEVQSSVWPEDEIKHCKERGINLL